MRKLIFSFLFAGLFLSRVANAVPDSVKFYCLQIPGQFSQKFDAGFKNCSQDTKDGKPIILKKENVCVENAMCAADTPEFEAKIIAMQAITGPSKPFASLNENEITNYMSAIDTAKHAPQLNFATGEVLKGTLARPSILTCPAVNGVCPHPSDCNEDYYYNDEIAVTVPANEAFTHDQAPPTGVQK